MVRRVETDLETLQRLGRARDFIDHCYDHPLSLDQISEKACFSRYHFLRLFRQAFNKTPHQYLIERRIEKAKGVQFISEPAERPYGIEAVFKDNSGNWFSLTQPS